MSRPRIPRWTEGLFGLQRDPLPLHPQPAGFGPSPIRVKRRHATSLDMASFLSTITDMVSDAIPDFLSAFDLRELNDDSSTLIALHPDGTILWTNPAFARFAEENDHAEVANRHGAGTSYFASISPALRSFYQDMFADALRTGEPVEHLYECHSPTSWRTYRLRVLPIGASGLLLSHRLVAQLPHPGASAPPIEASYRDQQGHVLQCSNCRCVRRLGSTAWDWVPAWVQASPVLTSHGICPLCAGFYWG